MMYERGSGRMPAAHSEGSPTFTDKWLESRAAQERELETDEELALAFRIETLHELMRMEEYREARTMAEEILAQAEAADDIETMADVRGLMEEIPSIN